MTDTSTPLDTSANVAKFTAALRSGEFSQSRMRLRDNKGFCCLGVACEVYHRETGLGSWEAINSEEFTFHVSDDFSGADLPDPVREWYGFTTSEGDFDPRKAPMSDDGLSNNLYRLNDRSLYSFAAIADVIDSKPAGLFRENQNVE